MSLAAMKILRSIGVEPPHSVYPGHPITIAYIIVKVFPTYAAAFKNTEHNFCEALGSIDIPGAGGNVNNALHFLVQLHQRTPFERAVEVANSMWDNCDNQREGGGIFAPNEESRQRFLRRWEEGQAQAELVKPHLWACRDWWLT